MVCADDQLFGKEAIRARIEMDRDRAYKRHWGQYQGRKVLSKIGLAKPITPPPVEDDDEGSSGQLREAIKVRSKLSSSRRRR